MELSPVLSIVRLLNPWYKKPIIEFKYLPEYPYIVLDNDLIFYRFSIENLGMSVAKNCSCEIISVEKNGNQYGKFIGFPLKWAGQNLTSNKLNLSRGEIKYIDLVMGVKNKSELHFLTNTNFESAIDKAIQECGTYIIKLLFVGDNFDRKTLAFTISLTNNYNLNNHINIKFHSNTWWKNFKNKHL